MTARKSTDFYLSVACLAGCGMLLAVALQPGAAAPVLGDPSRFLLLFGLLVVGDLRPISVRRGSLDGEINTGTTFCFALLLAFGPAPALVAQGFASVVADLVYKRTWRTAAFNLAQHMLSLVVAGMAFGVVAGTRVFGAEPKIRAIDMPALVLGASGFFLMRSLLLSGLAAIGEGRPLFRELRRRLVMDASTNCALLALSPILVVVAERSLPLMPVVFLPVVAVYRSARVSAEKEHQALHDGLTDLPNRTLFRDRVEQALRLAKRSQRSTAIMLIDLDRFKEVNDTLGHAAGDRLLQEIGPRLLETVREIDTIARLGGDEFAVLLPNVNSKAEVAAIADRIVSTLEQPFHLDDFKLEVEASIGIALFPEHGEDVESLMQKADVAMYLAKGENSGYEVYSSARDRHSRRRLGLIGQLRGAMNDRQLVLHYQPKAQLGTAEVTGVEALLRWHHPEHGMVPPNDFLPLAENTGLIRPLTRYVLNEALAQIRLWLEQGIEIPVAVNLSVRNLHDIQLPEEIGQLLDKWGVPASLLELEITESTIMADPIRARKILTALGDMGMKLAIDDFGTGYSSLAYLRRLPVNEIKIDQSFVRNMVGDENDTVIVRSTIDLARNLGLEVVAEGVESAEAWKALTKLGCTAAQGHFISKPVPPDELVVWLEQRQTMTRKARLQTVGVGA